MSEMALYRQLGEDLAPSLVTQSSDLTHFGVKGMRWGHRKKVSGSDSGSASDDEQEPYYYETSSGSEPSRKGRKIATAAAIGLTIGVGSIFAANYISKNGAVKVSPASITKAKKASKAFFGSVPAVSQLVQGQQYAAYTMTHLGGIPVSKLNT